MIINFAPKTVLEEVDQNIKCILTTLAGTVPLDREFGLDSSSTDLPTPFLQSQMTNKIIAAIQDFEPRAVVDNVTYDIDVNGKVTPKVIFHLAEGVEA